MSDAGIHLLVGTTKGAFVLDGDVDRSAWTVRGPFCGGWAINHVVADPETGTMWAGGGNDWTGAGVWRSTDGGATWELTKLTSGQMDTWAADDPEFAESIGWTGEPAPFGDSFAQVWSLARANGRVYAGTKPAALLESDDDGATFSQVKGLTDHPSARRVGAGGRRADAAHHHCRPGGPGADVGRHLGGRRVLDARRWGDVGAAKRPR